LTWLQTDESQLMRDRVSTIERRDDAVFISLTRTATLSITTAGVIVTWQNDIDSGGNMTYSGSSITVPMAGYYLLSVVGTLGTKDDIFGDVVVNGVEVATTADVTVTAASSAVLAVSTTESTTLVNGVGAGAALDVLDVIPNVLSVAVTGTFSGGADPEDDVAYTARARNRLARVTNSLVVADHFTAYVLEDGRAVNALCIPAWDGVATGTIGTDAGDVTVVTYGRGGTLSSGDKTDLAALMQAITYAGATVHVTDAAVTTVNVTTTIAPAPGYSNAEAQTAAEDAIRAFLNPETWPVGDDVLVGALQAAITDTTAVDYIVSMSAPSGTTTIAANAVASAGTLTVSV